MDPGFVLGIQQARMREQEAGQPGWEALYREVQSSLIRKYPVLRSRGDGKYDYFLSRLERCCQPSRARNQLVIDENPDMIAQQALLGTKMLPYLRVLLFQRLQSLLHGIRIQPNLALSSTLSTQPQRP